MAVVMPAFNEEALDEFLEEIEAALRPVTTDVQFVVVDDASNTALPVGPQEVLPLGSAVHVLRNASNRGHGPSALRAYDAGLQLSPDVVIHVDGDGQFLGEDFVALLRAAEGYDGVVGARTGRTDPWFRRAMTLGSRVMAGERLTGADVNSPLRLYRVPTLRRLLSHVSTDSAVPHLHFALLHSQLGLDVREISVRHRPRRGDTELGTTWQAERPRLPLPNRRLMRLALTAFTELRQRRSDDRAPALVPELLLDAT